jgi:hypothetical protein
LENEPITPILPIFFVANGHIDSRSTICTRENEYFRLIYSFALWNLYDSLPIYPFALEKMSKSSLIYPFAPFQTVTLAAGYPFALFCLNNSLEIIPFSPMQAALSTFDAPSAIE